MFLFFNINIIICLRTAPVEMFTVYHTLTYIHVCVCVCGYCIYFESGKANDDATIWLVGCVYYFSHEAAQNTSSTLCFLEIGRDFLSGHLIIQSVKCSRSLAPGLPARLQNDLLVTDDACTSTSLKVAPIVYQQLREPLSMPVWNADSD